MKEPYYERATTHRIMKERPRVSRQSARLQSRQEPIMSKVRSPETKHPLSSPTSITFNTESPQNISALLQNPKRKRQRSQELENPLVHAPAQHFQKRSQISTTHQNFGDTFSQPAADGVTPYDIFIHAPQTLKRPRVAEAVRDQTEDRESNSIAYWAATQCWPQEFGQNGITMSERSPSKRRSESMHRSDRLNRLAENGIFMKSSVLMQKSSKELCQNLLKHKLTSVGYTAFPRNRLSDVLERVQDLNESRVRRDITPWIVPSAETLFFCSDLNIDYIGDEVEAEWIRCSTMGSTRPKPDYTAGLLLNAFTKDEIQKLKNYSSPRRPFLFTPNLSFPFLICEVKTGEEGLNKADRQNIHSASIATRAIIELHKAAFSSSNPERVNELYGKALVFTVSHDNDRVCLYAHFAVLSSEDVEEPEFYRYPIAFFSLSAKDGVDTSAASDFVRNVYETIAPEHRQRIKEAAALLPAPVERTNLSFTTSGLALDEVASQDSSQNTQSQDNQGFKTPSLSASVLNRNEVVKLTEQVELQRKDSQAQISKLLEQMSQQMERQMEHQMERQMEQQIEQQRQQMEQQRQQMEQQRQQMEQQMEQQKEQQRQQTEIISLLKPGI